ncbi:hypothetical protein AcW2_004835 [Taiwanofungus camphoratus]|nr:hypothetical protein AcW2_004835 [Antrodia cinnamomea]
MSPITAPISQGEFFQLLQRCMPPGGWPSTLAVGNSGGPDSTCLLYLLSSVIKNRRGVTGLPRRVVSLHVDHDLQGSSYAMAKNAATVARSLSVEHFYTQIPWNRPPFPPRPSGAVAFEQIARDARYNRLFHAMTGIGAHAIAYGHHADDQVETAIMRMMKGSGDLGVGGMRSVRRWGMGEGRPLAWAGPTGMIRWIVRPLLLVSKDRILATCDSNGLEYINDLTNFQPSITVRNAIRQCLSQCASGSGVDQNEIMDRTIDNGHTDLSGIKATIQRLHAVAPELPADDSLREAVRRFGQRVETVDTQVTNYLSHCMLSSPPSVLLLRSDRLADITSHEIRMAMVRRILRCVSPRPWGSVRAESDGKHRSLERIVAALWENPQTPTSFSAKSNVFWIPGVALANGEFRRRAEVREGETPAWWIQRSNLMSERKLKHRGVDSPLLRDITERLAQWRSADDPFVRVIYDARFLVELDMGKMPEDVHASILGEQANAKVIIKSACAWYAPQVVWRRQGLRDEPLADFRWDELGWIRSDDVEHPRMDPTWIKMQFIRTLEAL